MNLDDAIYHAAHGYPGGVEALAVRMGLKPASLRHKVSPTYPTAHLSPQELLMLIEFCGPGPLHALCAEASHVAMPLPRLDIQAGKEVSRAMREAGEFLATSAAAIDDDRVTAREMADVERDALEAVVAIMAAVSGLRAMRDRAKLPPDERLREDG